MTPNVKSTKHQALQRRHTVTTTTTTTTSWFLQRHSHKQTPSKFHSVVTKQAVLASNRGKGGGGQKKSEASTPSRLIRARYSWQKFSLHSNVL